MKKIIFALFLLFQLFNFSFAQNFTIDNYDISLDIDNYNNINIQEKLDVDFLDYSHGIYREIPVANHIERADGKKYTTYTKISNVSVSEINQKYREGNNYIIKIGNPDEFIKGKKEYKINYTYSFNNPESELYFNIIGLNWDTTIQHVSFRITMPKDFPYDKVGFSFGEYGNIGYNEGLIYTVDKLTNTISGYTTKPLKSHEGITVRVELPKNYFNKKIDFLNPFYAILITFFLIISFSFWNKYGKDENAIPVVNFYPPKGMNSARVGLIYKESANEKEIVSLIIYLADKGYIKIKDDIKDVELQKLKKYDGDEYELKELMHALFEGSKTKVKISELSVSKNFYKNCKIITDFLNKEKNAIYEQSSLASSTKIPVMLSIIGLIVVLFLILFDMDFNYEKVMSIIPLSFFPIAGISIFNDNIKKISSFVSRIFLIIFALAFSALPIIFIFSIFFDVIARNFAIVSYCIIALVISVVCYIQLPKKSRNCLKTLGNILGFKKFLKTAEAHEIEKLVEKNPQYYFNVLPYAYVLDVSDVWIKKFENIISDNPDWYEGEFCPVSFRNLTDSLGEVSVPSESNGGITYSSSSGGGGFSGGGFGGGGGGSW